MKYFFLCILFFSYIGFSQTYRESFEKTEPLIDNGNSFSTNFSGPNVPPQYILHNTEKVYLDAFLLMYNISGDVKWLDKFIIHCIRIQHHRDDQIYYFMNEVTGTNCQPLLSSVPSANRPTWSSIIPTETGYDCNNGYVQDMIHTASLNFIMAEFVYLVLIENPSLQSNILPAEAIGYEPYPLQFYNLQTYSDFAFYLNNRIEQSIAYLNINYYCNETNGYKGKLSDDCNGTGNDCYPHNNVISQQCAMGELLAEMYLIEDYLGNSVLAQQFLEKVTKNIKYLNEFVVHSTLEIRLKKLENK